MPLSKRDLSALDDALRESAWKGSQRADRQPLYKLRVFWYSERLS
jgi:hypothetical protein